MDEEQRLSRIATQWSIVRRAHEASGDGRQSAQQILLDRYGGAVRRYLLACLRDADAAEEVFQDFAVRFLRGDFHSAHPDHGKFRAFLKTVIGRMVVDYHRRRQRRNRHEVQVAEDLPAVADPAEQSASVVDFSVSWREDLLARAWEQLRSVEDRDGRPYYTVLRCRVEQPETRSQELAALLSERLGKRLTAGNVRVLVHRARERFAEFLLEEVAGSVDAESLDQLEQELIELRLHDYCREPLERLRKRRVTVGNEA